MPNNVTDVDTFTDPIQYPADGESVDQVREALTAQGAGNRTRWLANNVTNMKVYLSMKDASLHETVGPFTGTTEMTNGVDINFAYLTTPDAGSTDAINAAFNVPRPACPSGRTVTFNGLKVYYGDNANIGDAPTISIGIRSYNLTTFSPSTQLYYGENTLAAADMADMQEWDISDFNESTTGTTNPHVYAATDTWEVLFSVLPKHHSSETRLRGIVLDFSIS